MKHKKYFTLFIGLLFFTTFLPGQKQDIKFAHLSVDDGLSKSWVKCIIQDYEGFIWFGTGGSGIDKYNGYEFEVYKNNPASKYSLTNNWISCIYEDKKHKLWVGTQHGLSFYDRDNNRFSRYPYLQNNYINGLYESDDGKLYVISDDIYEIQLKENKVIPFCKKNNDCFAGVFMETIVKDYKGNHWLLSSDGILLVDLNNRTLSLYRHDELDTKSISENSLSCLYKDTNGRIWIGTSSKGISLIEYENGNSEQPYFRNFPHNSKDINSISEGAVLTILDDGNGQLWVGIENGGVNILDLKTVDEGNLVFRHLVYNYFDNTSISNNSIHSIFKDKQGTIWIGTFAGGVNYYNELLYKFDIYRQIPITNSTQNKNVNVFFEEGTDLWIGTESGINILNKETGLFQHIAFDPNNPKSIGSDAIFSIIKDKHNNIWVVHGPED